MLQHIDNLHTSHPSHGLYDQVLLTVFQADLIRTSIHPCGVANVSGDMSDDTHRYPIWSYPWNPDGWRPLFLSVWRIGWKRGGGRSYFIQSPHRGERRFDRSVPAQWAQTDLSFAGSASISETIPAEQGKCVKKGSACVTWALLLYNLQFWGKRVWAVLLFSVFIQ